MREHERWQELCALAAKEPDPTRLRELVREINELLAKKQRRVDHDHEGSLPELKRFPCK